MRHHPIGEVRQNQFAPLVFGRGVIERIGERTKQTPDEEMADDLEENGNRKLVPIVARHGSGLDDGDYINMDMIGKFGKISEGRTRNELRKSSDTKNKGFDTENGVEQYTDISDIE